MVKWSVLILFVLLCAVSAAARSASVHKDSTRRELPAQLAGADTMPQLSERNERLYDSIASRYSHGKFSGLIYRSMFVHREADAAGDGKAVDESATYRPYQGRTISRVDIVRFDLVGNDSVWIERVANSLHAVTAEGVIRRDMLYKAGERLDADLLTRNNRNLRSRANLADAQTFVRMDPQDTTRVIVTVMTRDNWSISLDGSTGGSGRSTLVVSDANFLGSGDKLGIENNFSWRDWSYGGMTVSMDFPNVWGSFFNARVEAGRRWDNSTLGASASRGFQRTTDYMAGASWYNNRTDTYLLYKDSTMRVRSRMLDLWGGGSVWTPGLGGSLYLSARYTRSDFEDQPPTGPRLNPAFHDANMVLVAAGLYRERFYTANMVYGYGHREYLPVGYRVEIVAGYLDGEFGGEQYLGASYRLGGFNRLGYLMGGIGVGSFFPRDGELRGERRLGRGALTLESRYFTNLLRSGRTRIRQFVSVSYLQGWNRYAGSSEVVTFTDPDHLRGMNLYTVGVNRARLSLETVFFTPYQPWGFRLTGFAYSDMGLLGFNPNPFRNPYYSTIGVGVRIKNEQLVFRAIEIRLGLAVGHGGLIKSEYFTLSSQNRIDPVSFAPEPPHTVNYW